MSLLPGRHPVPDNMPEISPTPPPDAGDGSASSTVNAHKTKHVINHSPAHLTPKARKNARVIAVNAMRLLLNHAPAVHYSQGATRWDGINKHLVAVKGHYPTALDCSAAVTWGLWNALGAHLHKPDVVNGEHWKAGYTGTMVCHGLRIPIHSPWLWLPGDAVIYGTSPSNTEHTAMYVGYDKRYGHMVISHGSEGGPYYLNYNYRSDIVRVKRYI